MQIVHPAETRSESRSITLKDPRFALAYCLTAQAHDDLYFSLLDHTPERRARGDAAVKEALRLRPDLPEVHLAMAYQAFNLAIVYARTGNPDLAFGELNILIKTPGGVDYGELKRNPSLDSLRDDPRFKALLAQLAP